MAGLPDMQSPNGNHHLTIYSKNMTGKAKNTCLPERGRKRCFAAVLAGLFFLLGVSGVSAQGDNSGKRAALIGTWYRRTFIYTFEDSVRFRVVRPGSRDIVRGRYSWVRIGTHDCISLWGARGDSTAVEILLVSEITDSTAVIGLGTPFVREGKGRGITGQWKHMEPFRRIDWTFGPGNVEYRSIVYHPSSGEGQIVEARAGTYSPAEDAAEPGSFAVRFGGGAEAMVLPLVYRDMLYVFDLSPGKAFFRRGKVASSG